MLIYHPAQDVYHSVFRMLILLEAVSELEFDKARILDFYLIFPGAMALMKTPASMREIRHISKELSNPYRNPINPKTTFKDMQQLHETAIRCIAASGLVSAQSIQENYLVRNDRKISGGLLRKINIFREEHQELLGAAEKLASLPLSGDNGLKHRSGLMEHRYDNV